jgi:2-methylcitrate dehydratase
MDALLSVLTDYAFELDCDALGDSITHEVKRHLVDALGCGLGAFSHPPVTQVRSVTAAWPAQAGATTLGTSKRTVPELAAFANAFAMRYLDFNDTSMSPDGGHSSDNIAPILAAAEWAKADGEDVLAAIVVAYEIQDRLGDLFRIRDRGFDHVTYLSVSTAAASARVLGADREQIANAISIAAMTGTAHLQIRVDAVPMRALASAMAVRCGLTAALLAVAGVPGPEEPFCGPRGWFASFVGEQRPIPPFGDGSTRFKIQESRFKPFPADYETQAAVGPALLVRESLKGGSDEITRVIVYTSQRAIGIAADRAERWEPTTRQIADHSLPFVVAVVLQKGDIWLDDFDPAVFTNPSVRALMRKIEVRPDEEFSRRHGEAYGVRIEVHSRTGEVLIEEALHPWGHPKNPMSDAAIEEKFRRLASPVLGSDSTEAALKAIWALDQLGVRTVFQCLEVEGRGEVDELSKKL